MTYNGLYCSTKSIIPNSTIRKRRETQIYTQEQNGRIGNK